MGPALFFAAALAMTNAPTVFSTSTERSFACPVISEPAVGRRFNLQIPATSCVTLELALGKDVDGDGMLADEEAPFAFAFSRASLEVRDRRGMCVFASGYVPLDCPLTLDLKPGRDGTAATWCLRELSYGTIGEGSLDADLDPAEWTMARVRLSGPAACDAAVEMFRLRDAFTFIIR